MCISKSCLSSLRDDQAKYKDKVPDVSDSNHNVQATSNSKSKLAILKVGLLPSKKMFCLIQWKPFKIDWKMV